MSKVMDEEIKRWMAKRKSALALDIIQGKTTVAEASRQFDLPLSQLEDWADQVTVCYRSQKAPSKIQPRFAEPIKALIARFGTLG